MKKVKENVADTHSIMREGGAIDFLLIWKIYWQSRVVIVFSVSLSTVLGLVIAFSLPNKYTSTGVYAPAKNQSGAGGLAAQYGGLAAIAGINIGGSESNDVDQALALLKSYPFLSQVIVNHQLKAKILAVKKWDSENAKLIWDEDKYDHKNKKWLLDADGRPSEPTDFEAYMVFRDMISVDKDVKTNLISISLEYYSPELSENWLRYIINAVNLHFQRRDRSEAEKNIRFLEQKVDESSVAGMKSMLYEMIESQMQTLMLSEASEDYILRNVVPPVAPELKSSPSRALILLLSFLIGTAFTLGVLLLVYAVRGVE